MEASLELRSSNLGIDYERIRGEVPNLNVYSSPQSNLEFFVGHVKSICRTQTGVVVQVRFAPTEEGDRVRWLIGEGTEHHVTLTEWKHQNGVTVLALLIKKSRPIATGALESRLP